MACGSGGLIVFCWSQRGRAAPHHTLFRSFFCSVSTIQRGWVEPKPGYSAGRQRSTSVVVAPRRGELVRRPDEPHLASGALQVPRAVVLDRVRVLGAPRHRLIAAASAKEDPDGLALHHGLALVPRRPEALGQLGKLRRLEEGVELPPAARRLRHEAGVPALVVGGRRFLSCARGRAARRRSAAGRSRR